MPVDDLHPQYEEWASDWTRVRDAFGGRRQIKEKRTAYLPSPEAQTGPEYDDFLARAQWIEATERSTKGLAGAVLRTDTAIEVPDVMREDLEDVTLSNQDVNAFSQRILMDQILMGRLGVEVAMPRTEGPDQRPYWNLWAAESIVNWAEMRINGRLRPVLVVLKEPVLQRSDDFAWEEKAFQYRVLRLAPFTEDRLVYIQEIWIENPNQDAAGDEKFILSEQIIPSRRGVLMDEIPFTLFGASSIEMAVEKPPMLGVADHNIGWYVNSADYENALSAIKPLYVFIGMEAGAEIVLGSRRAVIVPDSDGDGKILQGADPVGLRNAMEEKRKNMGVMAGQILEEESGPAETLGAVRIRQGGRQASLRTIATTFGVGLEKVLGFHAKWVGANPEDIVATPNTDFIDATLLPDQLRAYSERLQSGEISYPTFYELLRGGEITRPGVTAEEELEEIEAGEETVLQKRQAEMAALEAERVAAEGDGEE